MVQDRPSSGHKKATRRWLLSKAGDSVEAQDPLGQLHGLIVADGVRRHGNRAPVTGAAVLDAVGHMIGIARILGGHLFHGRTDHLVVDSMTSHTDLGREQRLTLAASRGTALFLATGSRSRGRSQLFSAGVTGNTHGAYRLDALGNGFLGGRMGTASEQGKYCCRSSQNILRNRHLSILIMAIGMRPSAVPGQSGKYTAKAASGKIANHSSDKTPHPPRRPPQPSLTTRHGRKGNPRVSCRAYALVAQLDRVLPSEGRGHRFESCRVRHFL